MGKPATTPRQRCTAKVSYGNAWVAGRAQCMRMAKPGEAYCATHLRQVVRRLAETKGRETTE